MAGQGEAANGYRVYQQNQAKKKAAPVPVNSGVLRGIGYGEGRVGEAAAGQAKKDNAYAGAAKAQEDDFRMRQSLGLIDQYGRPPAHGPSPRGSGYGSGGGGGGGAAGGPAYDSAQLDALLAMMNGNYDTNLAASRDSYGKYDASLNDAYQRDLGTSNNAYAALDAQLANLDNPYAHIGPAAAAQVDPSALSNLIQSQGGGDAGLRAQAQYLQAQNGSSAAASDRLAQMLAATQASWNQGTQNAAKQSSAQNQGDLLSRLAALRSQGQQSQAQREADLLAQLQAAQQGIQLKRSEMQ